MSAVEVQGSCSERFEPVRAAFAENLSSGDELGASIVIDVDGQTVVDIWGGFRDQARTQPWIRDTITNVWSTTKTVTNLAALMLADRGLLDVHAPIARYWPDYGANGKQDIQVRQLLGHTSGVSGWDAPFVADEIAGPLGADFQIGALEKDWGRIADVVPPPPLSFDMSSVDLQGPAFKTLTGPVPDAAAANTPAWRLADMGAINGHGNARSVARILSAVTLGGTVDGVRLLGQEAIDLIFDEQANGVDVVLGVPLRFGIGYGLPNETVPYLPDERICFWGGWGGSLIVMDLGRRMTVSYMMNNMGSGVIGSSRSETYLRAIYGS